METTKNDINREKKNEKEKENIHKNHRKRLVEQLKCCGFNPANEHQMLEYILFFTNSQKDTNPIAHALLKKFDNFYNVLNAREEDLLKVDGIGPKSAQLISSLKRISAYYLSHKPSIKIKLEAPRDFINYYGEQIRYENQEKALILYLNSKNEVKFSKIIEEYKDSEVDVQPRQIYSCSIERNCPNVILLHNHPSGNTTPSRNDIICTKELFTKLYFLGITMLDHVVVSANAYYSFKQNGYIDNWLDVLANFK